MKIVIDIDEKDFKFIKSVKSIMKNSDTFQRIYADLFNAVKSGEVAEIQQGEWIIVDDCEQFIAKCSVCGRIEDSRMVKYHPFCRCGAKMVR